MQNGYFHETGKFAPETAVDTGAATPLVDPVVAATAVPTVDESTAGKRKNMPRANENSDIKPSGDELAEPKDPRNSTGEEEEVRSNPNAHANDAVANKDADTTVPTEPQAKRPNARPKNAPQRENLPK